MGLSEGDSVIKLFTVARAILLYSIHMIIRV